MFVKSIKFCPMLSEFSAFHVSGLLGFRWPLLRHRAMRHFIANTRHIPSALGHKGSTATDGCPGVRPSTTTQGGVIWMVCMLQQQLRMTISNHVHSQYIRNSSGGMAYRRMLGHNGDYHDDTDLLILNCYV
jgi:hypothetical protein